METLGEKKTHLSTSWKYDNKEINIFRVGKSNIFKDLFTAPLFLFERMSASHSGICCTKLRLQSAK